MWDIKLPCYSMAVVSERLLIPTSADQLLGARLSQPPSPAHAIHDDSRRYQLQLLSEGFICAARTSQNIGVIPGTALAVYCRPMNADHWKPLLQARVQARDIGSHRVAAASADRRLSCRFRRQDPGSVLSLCRQNPSILSSACH